VVQLSTLGRLARFMKILHLLFCISVSFAISRNTFGQGFVNLDFNAANLSPYGAGGSFVPAADAIPGWTGYLGSSQQTTILYNNLTTGEAAIAILGTNNTLGVSPIPGNAYTVVLQAGEVSASIAQTALIPATSESILFTATWPYASGWQVTVAGQIIPVSQVSIVGSGISIYAGDISAFAGQTDELRFTALAGAGSPVNMWLDSISFSTAPVPEPSVLSLSVMSLLFFILIVRRPNQSPEQRLLSLAVPLSRSTSLIRRVQLFSLGHIHAFCLDYLKRSWKHQS
jgi:hypothetical protein